MSPDVETARDALERYRLSSWWEWEARLRCLFLIWPNFLQGAARYGHNPWVTGVLPRFAGPQFWVE